jgi:iron complex outermembrane receptor protein
MNKINTILAVLFGLASCLGSLSAFADDAKVIGIEEIVVTGTKREVSSQDVPIAVTAISGEAVQQQFRNDILAITEMSPGVSMGPQAGFRAIAGGIRGTGQNSILVTQDSSVVMLVDEFATSRVQAQFVELFDLERIEIYRGPQGTLFGKSATGGAISIITKKPVHNETFGDLSVRYGTFAEVDGVPEGSKLRKYTASFNLPLIEDTLSMRATAIWDQDDGMYQNSKDTALDPLPIPVPGGWPTRTKGLGENLGGKDIFASKVKLLFTPNDNYEAYFIAEYMDDNSETPGAVQESDPSMLVPILGFPGIHMVGHTDIYSTGQTQNCPSINAFCVPEGHRVDVKGFHLHQTLKLDQYTVKLILGHREQKDILGSTYTGEDFNSIFDASRNTIDDQDQYEIRVASNFDGAFNFVAGASYAEQSIDMLAYATVGLQGQLQQDVRWYNDPSMTGASQDRETTAFYADGTYTVNDNLSITLGLRYTEDEKSFFRRQNPGGPCTAQTEDKHRAFINGVCLDSASNATSRVGGGFTAADLDPFNMPLPDSAFEIALRDSNKWDETTFRVVADYKIMDDSMVYLSYATGFIPGGYTETCSSFATCQPFNSETNENIEFGFKGTLADGTIQLNAAAFFTKYEDLIRSQVLPFTNIFGVTTQETVNFNTGKSDVRGVEGDIKWVVNDALSVSAFIGVMNHEYDEFEINGADLSDLDPPYSPDLKYGIAATYVQDIDFGSLTYNVNINHQDENEMMVLNNLDSQMHERTLVDANVTFRNTDETYYVAIWGKNLTDERYRHGANPVAGLWNFTQYGEPRTFGLEIGVSLGQ